jgi:hypothetical protein
LRGSCSAQHSGGLVGGRQAFPRHPWGLPRMRPVTTPGVRETVIARPPAPRRFKPP